MIKTNEDQLFKDVVFLLKYKYPERNISMRGRVVYIDNEFAFNSDGKGILKSLNLLCWKLKDSNK